MERASGKISWRLAGVLSALAAVVTAAAFLLPAGAVRLGVLAAAALPVLIFLIAKPEYILAIILFMRFTNFYVFLPVSIFRPLVLLLVVSIAATALDGRKFRLNDRFLSVMIAAFVLTAFHSMAFAEDLSASADAFETLLGVVVIILAIIMLVDTRKRFIALIALIVAATMVSNFLPLAVPPPGDYASKTLIWEEGVMRYEGYQLEANTFAFHQIFIIPILLFILARFGRPRYLRPLIVAALAGTVFVLMLSFSRGGFVGLLVILVSLLFVERRNKAFMTVAVVGAVILVAAAPALYWERILSLVEAAKHVSQDYAIFVRVRTLQVATLLGLRNPVFGVGIGNFIYQAGRFLPYSKVVHSAFLQIFSELGFPGLLIVLAILGRNINLIWSMTRSKDEDRAGMGKFLLVQQAAVAVSAMFIPLGYDYIFWLWLVLPSVAYHAYSRAAGEPLRT